MTQKGEINAWIHKPEARSWDYGCIIPHELFLLFNIILSSKLNDTQSNIVEFINAQGLEVPEHDNTYFGCLSLEFFMRFKKSNIRQLMQLNTFMNNKILPRHLLHDRLKGLNYLVSKNIVHKHIKSENIIWIIINNVYMF